MAESAQIGQKIFIPKPNPSQWTSVEDSNGGFQLAYKPKSTGENVLARLSSADGGPYQFLKVLEKVCDLGSFAGFGEKLSGASGVFRNGWTATIYPRLPGSFMDLKKAFCGLAETGNAPGFFFRKSVDVLHSTASFASAVGNASRPFLPTSEKASQFTSSALQGLSVANFVGDVCSLEKSVEDMLRTRAVLLSAKDGEVSPELILNLEQTQHLHMIKAMGAICSIASTVLGLGLLATCYGSLPGYLVLASTISVLGTVLSVRESLFKEGMKFKPIDFFDNKSVQYVTV